MRRREGILRGEQDEFSEGRMEFSEAENKDAAGGC